MKLKISPLPGAVTVRVHELFYPRLLQNIATIELSLLLQTRRKEIHKRGLSTKLSLSLSTLTFDLFCISQTKTNSHICVREYLLSCYFRL